jgi:hypothetical protein
MVWVVPKTVVVVQVTQLLLAVQLDPKPSISQNTVPPAHCSVMPHSV